MVGDYSSNSGKYKTWLIFYESICMTWNKLTTEFHRTPIPETAIIRTGNANVIYQSPSHRLMLLGHVDENQYLTAEDGAIGILFKIANLEEHEKINLLRNMKASYVGSDVNDITCFT